MIRRGNSSLNLRCIRGLVGEIGHTLRKGLSDTRAVAEVVSDGFGFDLPYAAADIIASLCEQLLIRHRRILTLEKKIFRAARQDRRAKPLESIPGIGPVSPSAISATANKAARIFWAVLTRNEPYRNLSAA
ncbi:MAG: hypothetical protein AAGA72_03105 [Pseudomonadota bacterium]